VRTGVFFALCLFAACAAIAPGEGSLSKESSERLAAQQKAGEAEAVRFALRAADAAPDDLRAQRKAAELLGGWLGTVKEDERSKAYLLAAATLGRLENHPEACTTRVEAGRVRLAADDFDGAAKAFATTARECHSVQALRAAAWPLRKLSRCSEVVTLAAQVWPAATRDEWVTVLDTVSMCSDDVSLRQNLAFAPSEVVSDYYALLRKRERERAAEEARFHAEQQRQESRSRCESECWSARNSCSSGCGSSNYCYSQCTALESACRAGCY
jgi:hypothetical protein